MAERSHLPRQAGSGNLKRKRKGSGFTASSRHQAVNSEESESKLSCQVAELENLWILSAFFHTPCALHWVLGRALGTLYEFGIGRS
jgi:hypothetical protein